MRTLTDILPQSQGTRTVTIPDPIPLATNSVGGTGGQPFTFTRLTGISKLTFVSSTRDGVNPVYITQITASDLDDTIEKVFGTSAGQTLAPQVIDLTADSIQSCKLYPYSSGMDGRLGGILIHTVNGQTFQAGNTTNLPVDLTIDGNANVKNYYVAGLFGKSGDDIDSLGFYLVEDPIVREAVQNFAYDLSHAPPASPMTLNTIMVENRSSEPQTSLISFTEDVSSTSEWSHAAGVMVGASVEISAGIPLIAEGSLTVSVEASYDYSWGGSLTTSRQFNYQANVDVAPGKKLSASVIVSKAQISIPWTATYVVERARSGIYTRQISGTYSGVSTHDVDVQYGDVS